MHARGIRCDPESGETFLLPRRTVISGVRLAKRGAAFHNYFWPRGMAKNWGLTGNAKMQARGRVHIVAKVIKLHFDDVFLTFVAVCGRSTWLPSRR